MKATHTVKIFGKLYKKGEELPDFGSLKAVTINGNIYEIEGLSADESKLPTTVGQGSQVFFLDTKKVKKFNESDKTWYSVN